MWPARKVEGIEVQLSWGFSLGVIEEDADAQPLRTLDCWGLTHQIPTIQ